MTITRIAIYAITTLFPVSVLSQTNPVRFAVFGDYGVDNATQRSVENLVKSWNPDFVVTTGDNSYGSNAIDNNIGKYFSDFIGAYAGSFGTGSAANRYFPCLGNHDYSDGAGVNAYLSYFTLPGTGVTTSASSGNERYYDFIQGPVHFFAVNSNFQESDGNNSASSQAQWLRTQLALSTSPWKIVFMHHPPYSSSSLHGSQTVMQWPFEDWGANAVFAGHDHTYERIIRDDNGDSRTIPYFVTGLGGRNPYNFPSSGFVTGSQVRYNSANGSMLVEATSHDIVFKFYSVAGGMNGTLIDSFRVTDVQVSVIDDDNGFLPSSFSLEQNIPNPFNPTTTINYNLPTRSHVEIHIYNMLGQKVTTLIDETKPAGRFSTVWDGADAQGAPVSSGIYLYILSADKFSETKKMALLK